MVELLKVLEQGAVFLALVAACIGLAMLIWFLLAECFKYLADKLYDLRRSWRARKNADFVHTDRAET